MTSMGSAIPPVLKVTIFYQAPTQPTPSRHSFCANTLGSLRGSRTFKPLASHSDGNLDYLCTNFISKLNDPSCSPCFFLIKDILLALRKSSEYHCISKKTKPMQHGSGKEYMKKYFHVIKANENKSVSNPTFI